jgi:hypothetical protein
VRKTGIQSCKTAAKWNLKGQCHENFCFRFFHETSSPKPLNITLGPFQIVLKICGDICSAPPASTTPAVNVPTCADRVVDTNGKFITGVNNTGGKFLKYQQHWW